jgi:Ca2+-binding EF-hand superfamily protein
LYIAHQSPEHVSQARRIFSQLDTNNDGFISADEMTKFLDDRSEAQTVITGVDADMNGKINWTEYLAAASTHGLTEETLNEAMLRKAFNFFDQNKDGVITIDEMKSYLKEKLHQDDWCELVDDSQTGIDFECFKNLVMNA